MELDFASYGVYSLAGKRHPNEDRWVAFTQLHLCSDISAPAWQLKKKKKKKKKDKAGKGGREEEEGGQVSEEAGYLPLSFFAVYDGHGGSLCVETVSARLHKYIINQRTRGLFFLRDPELINDTLIREAIRRGFEDMDKEVIRTTEQKGDSSGSCAVVIILLYNRVFIAHVGDTRAVLGQVKGSGKGSLSEPFSPLPTRLYGELKKTNSENSIPGHCAQTGMMSSTSADAVTTPRRWERRMSDEDRRVVERGKLRRKTLKNLRTVDLTEDHKASSEKEKKRMKLKGGFVANGRVFGVLAVARAFGDRSLKMSPQEYQIRKIKGPNAGVMKRDRSAEALSQESSDDSSDDDKDKDQDTDQQGKGKDRADEGDGVNGDESGTVSTDSSTTTTDEEDTAAAATTATADGDSKEEKQQQQHRSSRRLPQRGKDLNSGLPFDNDELWGWVESRMDDVKAVTDFEAEEKARKAAKKAEKAATATATTEGEGGGQGDGEAGGGSPRRDDGGDKKGKKKKEKDSYEAMTEKEMKRRQDKALKKRSKQIKKEREQLKEKERKVKEMAKIQERRGSAGEGVVVALPDIDCRIVSPDDRFILIASDGLWDVCPSKESVRVVSQLYLEQMQRQSTPSVADIRGAPPAAAAGSAQPGPGAPVGMLRNICESVCRSARKGGSSDDITCLLIALHPTLI